MATILLAEDDVNLANIFVKWLESLGHRVTLAANGEDAFGRALQDMPPPDLVITDVMMPQWDGGDLAFFLGSTMPDLPILVVTACSDADKLNALRQERGVREILKKPLTRATLSEAVNRILTGR